MIIPEVEAIATPELVKLEKEGYNVIPTANATFLTMNRKGIRQLAHETLGLPTSNYRFAATREEFDAAIKEIEEIRNKKRAERLLITEKLLFISDLTALQIRLRQVTLWHLLL